MGRRAMATSHAVQAVIGLTGFEAESGGVRMSKEHFARLDLPQSFTMEHIKLLQNDMAILSEMAEKYPEDMIALHNAVLEHDFKTANQLADKMGLNEEEIIARGGGVVEVVVAAVIIAVLVGAAIVLAPERPRPGPPPLPEGGPPATDAGTDVTDAGTDAGTG
jgi:hypothetical protein